MRFHLWKDGVVLCDNHANNLVGSKPTTLGPCRDCAEREAGSGAAPSGTAGSDVAASVPAPTPREEAS